MRIIRSKTLTRIMTAFAALLVIGFFSATASAVNIVVTNNADSGLGSLRNAMLAINAQTLPNQNHVIQFNLAGSGVRTITPLTPLPSLRLTAGSSLTIDGSTQPGYGGTPLIELSGASAGAGADGLRLGEGIYTIRALTINRFGGNGINLEKFAPNDPFLDVALNVYGCFIGTTSAGTAAAGNGANGIRMVTATEYPSSIVTSNNIGGTGPNDRNVISGNGGDGLAIDNFSVLAPVNVYNNFIGTNVFGSLDLGNGGDGIEVASDSQMPTNIGGGTSAQRNVIAGNNGNGINSFGRDVYIRGNYVGLESDGLTARGNTQNGVLMRDFGTVLGGAALGQGNVISANGQNGVKIIDGLYSTNDPIIVGNIIGLDSSGTSDKGNAFNGIYANVNIQIGGLAAGEGNTIAGNGQAGIFLDGVQFDADGVRRIYGNKIGVIATGASIANDSNGIHLLNSNSVEIAGNTVGGNGGSGIFIDGDPVVVGSFNNRIVNNFIGVRPNGQPAGNALDGIRLVGYTRLTRIEPDAGGNGNTIAFNDRNGIAAFLRGNSVPLNNLFSRNSIYSNGLRGIDLDNDGVSPNDPLDTDDGANGRQNFPVIAGASTAGINGFLPTFANTTFEIEFYRADSCDGTHGEGRYFLGSTMVTTDANGIANFNATGIGVAAGQIVTATATSRISGSPNGQTSEFSQCFTATPPPGNFAFSTATPTVNEGFGSVALTVVRTNGSTGTVNLDYATANGSATAGSDYTPTSGTLTFLNGETSKTITVPVTDDLSDEPAETFSVTISNPTNGAVVVSPSTAVVTIGDNDNPPTASIGDFAAAEGNDGPTAFTFNVSLSQPSAFPVTVAYATANGTANAPVDFAATSGTLDFAAGETSKTVTVNVNSDFVVEIDETFTVNLSAPVNATIGDGVGVGTIRDDDNPGKLEFSQSPYTVSESAETRVVTVTRTGGTAGTVTVDYATTGGTATPGADYVAAGGTLVFGNGETSKIFLVAINDDQITEPTESIGLALSNPIGGATLGARRTSFINLLDDDAGPLYSIAGTVRKPDSTPLANTVVRLFDGQNFLTRTTDSLGGYVFNDLQANRSYVVTPSALGFVFNPISLDFANLGGNVGNANFTATPAPSRSMRVVGGDAAPGGTAVATVELVAQGDENSVGFSLAFDPSVLSNPQVQTGPDALDASLSVNTLQTSAGRLGVLLARPAGLAFPAGTRKLVTVTFTVAATSAYTTPLAFGDAPLAREIANANADALTCDYADGTIVFAQGYEADVAPRPTGSNNGTVTVADFAQIGRFVAGIDVPDRLNEFQRADSAPRATKGDGVLSVRDYTQAGRFAAGLDPVQNAGGLSAPLGFAPAVELLASAGAANAGKMLAGRNLRVVNVQTAAGAQVLVNVEIDSLGDENGVGFSVSYDAQKLSAPLVFAGGGIPNMTLITNTLQSGKVGVVAGLPAGQTFAAGTRTLVQIRFNVAPSAAAGPTPIAFGDAPVFREVVDVNADVLPANYAAGAVNIIAPTAATATIAGRVADAQGNPLARVSVTLTAVGGATQTVRTNSFGRYRFDVPAGATYIVEARGGRTTFVNPTRVVTVDDSVGDVDFTGSPQ